MRQPNLPSEIPAPVSPLVPAGLDRTSQDSTSQGRATQRKEDLQTPRQSRQEDRHEVAGVFAIAADHPEVWIAYVMAFDSRRRKSAAAQAALSCDRLIEQRFPPVNFHEMEEHDE